MIQAVFDCNNLLLLSARVPQIYKNFASKSTGQLSLATCLINLVGALIRIFTSLVAKAGGAMMRAFLLGEGIAAGHTALGC